MMPNDDQIVDYFTRLSLIAAEVIEDRTPNTEAGHSLSNADLSAQVCSLLGVEEFDLLKTFDYEKVYDEANPPEVLAHALVAFLRMQVFRAALMKKFGEDSEVEVVRENARTWNSVMAAREEVWNMKFTELWSAGRNGEEVSHKWLS